MSRRYELSRAARTDLLQAWNYLAENASFDVADKVIADLYDGMDRVAELPTAGHSRPDLTDLPVLFYRVHKYLILYTTVTMPIGIVRVLHGSRDIPTVLGGP